MANPLTTPQSVVPVAPLHELLNIDHSRPFSLLFGNYSWLLGAAGGLTVIWAVLVLVGRRRGVEYRFSMPLAAALIIGGFLNVLAEPGQPSRLIYGYFLGWQRWDTAIIKYGIILLPLYLALCWWLTFQAMERKGLGAAIERLPQRLRLVADFFSLWSRRYSIMESDRPRHWVVGAVIALSLFAPMYSGIFLMNEHGVAVWNSPAQPLIFMASAIAQGALMMVGGCAAAGLAGDRPRRFVLGRAPALDGHRQYRRRGGGVVRLDVVDRPTSDRSRICAPPSSTWSLTAKGRSGTGLWPASLRR